MANLSKTTYSQACAQNALHIAREDGDNINHSNHGIDRSRTKLNYSLLEHKNDRQYLKQRLGEVAHIERKDMIASADFVITVPKEVPTQYHRAFFEECVKWAQARYGEANVWCARVHMDETTPHLHMGVVPTVEATKLQQKKGFSERLCFDEAFSKRKNGTNEYQRFHSALQAHMIEAKIPGGDRVLNGATANGNKTVRELKGERAHQHEHERVNPFRSAPERGGR